MAVLGRQAGYATVYTLLLSVSHKKMTFYRIETLR